MSFFSDCSFWICFFKPIDISCEVHGWPMCHMFVEFSFRLYPVWFRFWSILENLKQVRLFVLKFKHLIILSVFRLYCGHVGKLSSMVRRNQEVCLNVFFNFSRVYCSFHVRNLWGERLSFFVNYDWIIWQIIPLTFQISACVGWRQFRSWVDLGVNRPAFFVLFCIFGCPRSVGF